jgi:hypothetical protein
MKAHLGSPLSSNTVNFTIPLKQPQALTALL